MGKTLHEESSELYEIVKTADELLGSPGFLAAQELFKKRQQKPLLNINDLFKLRYTITGLLAHYLDRLEAENSALYPFFDEEQKKVIKDRLQFTYYLLYIQHQLNAVQSQKHPLKNLTQKMQQCEALLILLGGTPEKGEAATFKQSLNLTTDLSEKNAKYCGLFLAKWLKDLFVDLYKEGKDLFNNTGDTAEDMNNEKINLITRLMTRLNGKRLYWVWGGGMLGSVLAMLPDDFYDKMQADQALTAVAPVSGYISWVLYYARFGFNLFLFLKHTVPGPWMSRLEDYQLAIMPENADIDENELEQNKIYIKIDSGYLDYTIKTFSGGLISGRITGEDLKLDLKNPDDFLTIDELKPYLPAILRILSEEKGHLLAENQIPIENRIEAQWEVLGDKLINDLIWGSANLIQFFWLYGPGMMGYWGNVSTTFLLVMDLCITINRYEEDLAKHKSFMLELYNSITNLEKQRTDIEKNNPGDRDRITTINQKITEIEKIIQKTALDWKYKQYAAINDITYAAGLILAFAIVACFFLTPGAVTPAALLIIALVGASLCFLFNAISAAVAGGLDIAKSRELMSLAKERQAELSEKMDQCTDGNQRQIYAVMLKDLQAEITFHQNMARSQAVTLVRAVMVDALVPFLVFVSFVFMPLGAGVGVLAGGFAMAVLSDFLINFFEPQKAAKAEPEVQLEPLHEHEVQAETPHSSRPRRPSFFNSNQKREEKSVPSDSLDSSESLSGSPP